MSPSARLFWAVLGAVSIAFHLALVFSGLVPNLVSRPLHMALIDHVGSAVAEYYY